MPLQADTEKEAWVDPQDAFHNYRLLTAGRECFVVGCAWLTFMMLHVLRRDSGAETDHLMLESLLRCTVLPSRQQNLAMAAICAACAGNISKLIFCLLLTADCVATTPNYPS